MNPAPSVVGTVMYELDGALVKRVEVIAICEDNKDARQWMVDHQEKERRRAAIREVIRG